MLSQISNGQIYTPFISADSTDQWMDFQTCAVNGGPDCLEDFLTAYSVSGDTSFNGQDYALISAVQQHSIYNGFFGSGNCTISSEITTFFAGGIREANKQVFYFNPINNSEYLMYDFNLTIGDTVPDPSGINYGTNYHIIDSLDSILIDGSFQKRYYLPEINGVLTQIVEGIGASTGLRHSIFESISCYTELTCYKENEIELYSIGSFCEMNLGVDEEIVVSRIFPNPTSDFLTIKSEFGSEMEVEFITTFGQIVLKKSITQSSSSIDVSSLEQGIYFVKVLVDGKVGIQKVVIE